jgi:competence protein ComEC
MPVRPGCHLQALTIDVLAPVSSAALASSEADGTEVNNSSLVLAAETRAGWVLLTGDIELAAQADLLAARARAPSS